MINKHVLLAALITFSANAQQSLSDLQFGSGSEASGQPLDNIVAVVGNDIITRQELNNSGIANPKQALQQLIMRKLLLQEAQKFNVTVGDTALNMAIADFAKQKRTAKRKGESNSAYRNRIREDLTISKLRQQILNQLVQISTNEVDDIVAKELRSISDSVRLIDILIRVPASADASTLNQAQAKTQQIISQLQTQSPESIAQQYDDVLFNDLGWVELSQIPASFSKILVDAPLNQYTNPIIDKDGIHLLKVLDRKSSSKRQNTANQAAVETQAAHILIKGDNAQKTINRLYQQLKQGANFAKLAARHSQDSGSAAQGGSLNWVSAGQMVPEFEQAMNNTQTGQFSKPFKSQFGYHIVAVNERRKATTANSRSALEQQAKQSIFKKRAAEEWELWLARLRDEALVDIRQPVK